MVQTFTLSPFDEDVREAGKDEEFIGIFDQLEEEPAPPEEEVEEPVDIEAETRRIFEEAFVQGEKAGYEMGLQRVEPLVKRLNSYISELDRFKGDLFERSEKMSLELALILAEAIILRSCDEKREIIADMVRKGLEICEGKSDITIRVRPGDAQYISCDGNGYLKVVPDDTIHEPGFVIETNFGDIDGRVSTQIEELRKRVAE